MICRAFNMNYFEIDNLTKVEFDLAMAYIEQQYK